jgi:YbbR domain-containing protein
MNGRRRSETIGQLGRSAARRTVEPASSPPSPPPKGGKGNAPKGSKPQPSPTKPHNDVVLVTRPRRTVAQVIKAAFVENLGLKLLSAILALTLYLLINTDREREITARVGVSYALPEDRVLVSERLDEVRVTIRGPWRRLRRFDERELDRVNLDLRTTTSSEVVLTKELVTVPTGLTVTSISPRSLRVAFEKRVEKKVEISPTVSGQPDHGFSIAEVKVEPASVTVRGPEGAMRTLSMIRTRELRLDGHNATFASNVELLAPEGVELQGGSTVVAHVRVEEQLATQRLAAVPITVVADGVEPSRVKTAVSKVDVTLTGPVLDIERSRTSVKARIKIGAADIGKTRDVAIELEGVPAGVGVRLSPESVKVTIRK